MKLGVEGRGVQIASPPLSQKKIKKKKTLPSKSPALLGLKEIEVRKNCNLKVIMLDASRLSDSEKVE